MGENNVDSLRGGNSLSCARKKTEPEQHPGQKGAQTDSLKTFHERLRNLCAHDPEGDGNARQAIIQTQTEQAVRIAGEFGILIRSADTVQRFRGRESDLIVGTEHMVERFGTLIAKLTNPPGFGLVPHVRFAPRINLKNPDASLRMKGAVEFTSGTPLEYLDRWMDANELFNDDVRLASVIQWADGAVSLGITQPQYHGEPATLREIERYFLEAGWMLIPDKNGHIIFYNYNWEVRLNERHSG